ncbi:exported hypothetical protein [Klebsiella pneumoniae]|nr:exported hypothetical protein [Klebsiella pneumoniae]
MSLLALRLAGLQFCAVRSPGKASAATRDNAPSTICFHLVIKLRYSSASGLTGNENEKSKILFAGAAGGDPRGAGGRLLLAALWQPGRITQDCPAAVRTPSATAAKPVAVRGSEPQGRLCAV